MEVPVCAWWRCHAHCDADPSPGRKPHLGTHCCDADPITGRAPHPSTLSCAHDQADGRPVWYLLTARRSLC